MAKKAKGLRKLLSVSRDAPAGDAVPRDGAPKAKAKIARKRKTAVGVTAGSLMGAVALTARRLVKPKTKAPRKNKAAEPSAEAAEPPAPPPPRRKPIRPGETLGRLERLEIAIGEVRHGARSSLRTRKLLASGVPKMAQKVIEEAAETAIEAIRGDRAAFVQESVDLFYNLLALCSELGIPLAEIWAEMDRRELALGMAEKLPKPVDG